MTPQWWHTETLVPYDQALATMMQRVDAIARGDAPELIWMLEHPPLYTLGTSGQRADLHTNPYQLPVYETGRGGQVTYHGPGQRVGYVMLNLKARGLSPRAFTTKLEQWLQTVLQTQGLATFTDPTRIGVWTTVNGTDPQLYPPQERKIAAIGVRIRKGVTSHGFALNICPDLRHFDAITPCGLSQYKATSLEALGKATGDVTFLDALLRQTFKDIFDQPPA